MSKRIREAFSHGKAFIPFVTAGDPSLEVTARLVPAMAAAGADLIELGIPFSDPVAEGPVIQQADERALAAGATTDRIFELVRQIRRETDVPLAFMTYLNPVFTYGAERFLKACGETGVDALIVPDMPFEEKGELAPFCRRYGVDLVSLIAPTSRARIRMIAAEAEGFLYCVSSMGVTGVRQPDYHRYRRHGRRGEAGVRRPLRGGLRHLDPGAGRRNGEARRRRDRRQRDREARREIRRGLRAPCGAVRPRDEGGAQPRLTRPAGSAEMEKRPVREGTDGQKIFCGRCPFLRAGMVCSIRWFRCCQMLSAVLGLFTIRS